MPGSCSIRALTPFLPSLRMRRTNLIEGGSLGLVAAHIRNVAMYALLWHCKVLHSSRVLGRNTGFRVMWPTEQTALQAPAAAG